MTHIRIGLIDVDSHNFPNLCLMKLSAYHKAQGHQVCFWNPLFYFDVVYKSRVFTDTYSKDSITVRNAGQVIKGGTGYGPGPDLPDEIEHSYPDYSLYPQYSETAYGFLSRGCPRGCGFCIVGGKEGRKSRKVADLSEFWRGQREIKLMDANLLACPDHESLLLQLPPLNTYHFRQRLTRQPPGFPRSLYIRAESFKAGAIFYFRHITSPIYIV